MLHAYAGSIRDLFAREIPEVSRGDICVKAVARKPLYRTKVALESQDQSVDVISTCMGPEGCRIKRIVDALRGERIDLVLWSDDRATLVKNALQPARVEAVVVDEARRRATVLVTEDERPFVVGRRALNLRLASELCKCEIVVETL
ncbi:MAG: hypothetical protein ACYSWU_13465 [Planctomycetota bacterium]|jgi:N utilization substance protein A